jgi:hypothetical protein
MSRSSVAAVWGVYVAKREVKGAEEANVKLKALYPCLGYRLALVLFRLAFVDLRCLCPQPRQARVSPK